METCRRYFGVAELLAENDPVEDGTAKLGRATVLPKTEHATAFSALWELALHGGEVANRVGRPIELG